MSANIDAVLARLDEMNNGEINYEVYRELHDLVSAIEDDVQAPIELFPGTLEALDALSIRARTTSPDAATEASGSSKTLADEYLELLHDMQAKYVKDTDILFLACKKAEAERDAALAAIERVRDEATSALLTKTDPPNGWSGALDYLTKKILAALDGAPEPEWEYGCAWDDGATQMAFPVEAAAAHLRKYPEPNGRLVRRRPGGPWLPVEGEKP